ncbi:MAG: 50S ribosomal protein L15 [Deltaproteobacteria bacterium]|nr:50S ribosomal protein L15 [Deltaproteobacteria bacterium]
MDLSRLKPAPGAHRKRKRVGRGDGSGHGKTSCRGHKGQGSRAGGGVRPGFEGGQMPLKRRVPKRGFRNPFRKVAAVVNVGQLEVFDPGSEVTPELLRQRGVVRKGGVPIKILGDGSLTKTLTVKAHSFSTKAKEKIEASGGKAELLPGGNGQQ